MATYFTADTHFGHHNIIRLSKRPFNSADEMDETMIKRWNSVVGPDDDIWHLGDFAFRHKNTCADYIFSRLNGNKRLIIGNHDSEQVLALPWAQPPLFYNELALSENGHIEQIVLFHYGIRSWNGMFRKSIHLYGHSHGNLPGCSRALDVGVDCWDYTPVSLKQIKARMATLPEMNPEAIRDLV